jgi:hypothetical protein
MVVSELPPVGDYAEMTCFNATLGGADKTKVNNYPGSVHITATIKTTGPCSGFGTISNPKITLTLPVDFSFADSGPSPKAHVFIGPPCAAPSNCAFDLHSGAPLTEVTAAVLKKISVSGQTVTVDLSGLDVGQGPGVIPSDYAIYVRAHAMLAATVTAVPPTGTEYIFRTEATAGLPGITDPVVTGENKSVFVLPAIDSSTSPYKVCTDGNYTPAPTGILK